MEKIEAWLKEKQIQGQLSSTTQWRDRTDVFNAFSLKIQRECCVKIMESPDGSPSDADIYTEEFKRPKEEGQMVIHLAVYDYLMEDNKMKAIALFNSGQSLTRFMHMHEEILEPGQAAALALKLLDHQKLLKLKGWRMADQIPSSLIFEGKYTFDILPLTLTDSNFKRHVYKKYANALSGGEIFPYPPETLYSAISLEDGGQNERGDSTDVWAIGVILFIFLGGSKQTLLKLVDYTKRPEGILELEGIPLSLLFKKIFETSTVRRISIDALRNELEVVQRFTGKAIKPKSSYTSIDTNIDEKHKIHFDSDSIESLFNRGRIYLQERDYVQATSCFEKCLGKVSEREKIKQTAELSIKRKEILRKLGKIDILLGKKPKQQNNQQENEKDEGIQPSRDGQKKASKQKRNKISNSVESEQNIIVKDTSSNNIDANNRQFNSEIQLIFSGQSKQFSQSWKILWDNYIIRMFARKLTRAEKSNLYLALKACFDRIISEIVESQTLQGKNTAESSTNALMNVRQSAELARIYARALIDPDQRAVGQFLEQASVTAKDLGKNEQLSKELLKARDLIVFSLVDVDAYEQAKAYAKEIDAEELFNEYFMYHIGEMDYQQKNYADAKIMMGRVLEANPNYTKANLLMARCAWSLQEYNLLGRYLTRCLQIDPDMQEAKELQKEWKEKGQKQGEDERFLDNLDEKLMDSSLTNEQDPQTGILQTLESLIKRIPAAEKPYDQLKLSLEGQTLASKQQALTTFYGSHMEEDINNSFLIKTGRERLLSGSREESLSYFQAALIKWPHSAHLKHTIGSLLFRNNFRMSMAMELFKQAMMMAPQEFYSFYYQQARCHVEKDENDQALEQLDNLLKYAPNHAMGLAEYGKILVFHKKEYQSALKILKRSMRICDQSTGIYGAMGVAYYKVGKLDYAAPCLKLSRELEKQNDYVDFIYGKAAYYNNQLIEAITVLHKLLDRKTKLNKNKQPTINFYIGLCKKDIEQKSIGFFETCALTAVKEKQQITAIKIVLGLLMNHNENEDLISFMEKTTKIIDEANDPDLNALMAKAMLKCEYHYLLAIRYVEQGLQTQLFVEEDKDDDIWKNLEMKSPLQFGCMIQVARIQFLMGRNADMIAENVQELLKEMEKNERIIQESKQPINKGIFKIREIEAEKTIGVNSKKQRKQQSWFVFDWISEAQFLLAEIFISQERFTDAQGIMKSLQSKMVSPQILRSIAHLNIVIQFKLGPEQLGHKMLTKNLKHDASIFLFGKILFEQGNQESGYAKLNAVLKNNKSNISYCKTVGDLEFEAKKYSSSLLQYKNYFDQVSKQNGILEKLDENRVGLPKRRIELDCETIAKLGFCYQNNQELKMALKMFQLSLSINPKCLNAWRWFINQKIQLKDFSKAEVAINNYLQIQEAAEIRYQLGICRLHQNNRAAAIEQFQQAEKLDGRYFKALCSLGEIYLEDKSYEISEKYFRKCRELDENDEVTLLGLGNCLWRSKQSLEEVAECFDLSLKNNEGSKKSFHTVMEFCKATHRLPEIDVLQKYYELYKDSMETLFWIGESFYQAAVGTDFAKYTDVSSKHFEQLNLLLSSSKEFRLEKYLPFLRLAQMDYISKEFDDSLKNLKKFIARKEFFQPKKDDQSFAGFAFEAKLLEAKLLIQRRTFNQSRIPKILMQCIKMKPSNELPYLHFALHLITKNSSAAWKFFEKAKHAQSISNPESQQSNSELFTFINAMKVLQVADMSLGILMLEQCGLKFTESKITFFQLGKAYLQLEKYNLAIEKFEKCLVFTGPLVNEGIAFSVQANIDCLCYLGIAQQKIHNNSEALKRIKQCLDMDNNNSTALRIRSEIFFEEGNLIKAMESAQYAKGFDDSAAQSYNIIAIVNLRMGNIFLAIKALEECNRINPRFPLINLKLAMIYEHLARPSMALQYFLNHLAFNPNSALVLCKVSKLFGYLGKVAQAEQHADRLQLVLKERDLRRRGEEEEKGASSIQLKKPALGFKEKRTEDLADECLYNEEQVDWGDFYEIKGYLSKLSHDYPQSLMHYNQAIALVPNSNSNPLRFSLAEIYSQLHNYSEEIDQYNRMISNNPAKSEFQYQNNLGNAYVQLRNYKRAAYVYKLALEQESSSKILGNLGACLIAQHQYDAALKALDHALAIERDHSESFFLSGLAYQGKNDTLNSARYFEKAIKSDPTYSPAYLSLAQMKISSGKDKEAIQLCQQCLSQSQKDLQVLQFLGDTHLKTGDAWAALAVFEQILMIVQTLEKITEKSKEIELQSNLKISRILEQLGEADKAINHLESCLERHTDHPAYLHELGKIMLNHKKNFHKALDLFKQASNDQPDNEIYLFSMADALHRLHRYEHEIECLNQCLELKPSFPEKIYNNIALSYQSLHQPLKSLKLFQKGIANCPEKSSQQLHFNFGNLLYSQYKNNEAAKHYEKCLEMNPDHFGALNNLANISLQLKDYQKAVNCFKKCLNMATNHEQTHFYSSRISILLKKGYYPAQI